MKERNVEKGLLQERLEIDLFELKVLKARVLRESTAIVSSRDDFKPFIFSFRKPWARFRRTMGAF
jgi:hypothetical protein